MIRFVDLKAQYHSIKEEIDSAVLGVLESTQFVLGKEVAAFEEEFATYSQAAHGVAVNSGTSALHLAFLAAGIGPGDEVITVPNTFIATVAAIRYTGATPVFVEMDEQSFNMDPAKIEAAITDKTKAICPVHLFGQMADMDPIMAIARKHKLLVIEDAAQAHGAEYKGRRAGSIGDLGCFSFYPGKNLGAYGEGGLVTTNNPDYAKTVRMLRDWGAEKKYYHDLQGYQLPHGRYPGRHPARQAAPPGRLDGSPPRARCAVYRAAAGFAGQTAAGDGLCPSRVSYLLHPQQGSGWLAAGAERQRDPERHPLPHPGARAKSARRPGLQAGRFPPHRAGSGRDPFPAHVRRVDR